MTTVKPILFNGDMVRAILEGRKTQTRRIIKPQPYYDEYKILTWSPRKKELAHYQTTEDILDIGRFSPYGETGGALWVRETLSDIGARLTYRADKDDGAHCMVKKWTPSIYMPRWASRITLEIKDIRVERLRDISEEDAMAEGVPENIEGNIGDEIYCSKCQGHGVHGAIGPNMGWTEVDCSECDTAIKKFKNLWNYINGPESWESNPWVWVVEFKHHEMNIDKYLERLAA